MSDDLLNVQPVTYCECVLINCFDPKPLSYDINVSPVIKNTAITMSLTLTRITLLGCISMHNNCKLFVSIFAP